MSLEPATPLGALVGLAVLAPLAAARLRERRHDRLRVALGLGPSARPGRRRADAALLVLFALLAAAASQPVLGREREAPLRADAEAFVVFDSTRSMLAAGAPGAPTRFERAVEAALRFRALLPDVPVGAASMTDRTLPHLFPTGDREAFAAVVRRALGVETPPPREVRPVATDLALLGALGRENFFLPRTERRLVLVLSDLESQPFSPAEVLEKLGEATVSLVLVRIGSSGERIWRADGTPEPRYASGPPPADVAALATAAVGGRVFGEEEIAAAARAAAADLGTAPASARVVEERRTPLAPVLLLVSALPLGLLLSRGAPGRLHTVWCSPWRGSWRTAGRRSRRAPARRPPS